MISVFIGRLPAMKITEPYSPTARASASVNPVASDGRTVGRITRRNTIAAARAERFGGFLEARVDFLERRLHRAHDERHADQRQRHDYAEPRVRDLDAERLEPATEPPLRREHGRERDAGHGRRQRER